MALCIYDSDADLVVAKMGFFGSKMLSFPWAIINMLPALVQNANSKVRQRERLKHKDGNRLGQGTRERELEATERKEACA